MPHNTVAVVGAAETTKLGVMVIIIVVMVIVRPF
jgi:hypothetical protein